MENKMNFFEKAKAAVCSIEAYINFARQSLGKGILYIFLLSLILGGIVSIKGAVTANKVMKDASSWVTNNVPHFSLSNGELQVDGDMPMLFEEDGGIIIIDTENEVDTDILDNYTSGIIITSTQLYGKKSTGEVRIISFADLVLEDMDYTGEEIGNIIQGFGIIMIITILLLGTILWFIGKFISLFTIVAIGGLITGALTKCKTNYEMSCKIGAYALTAPMLLKCIVSLVGITIPFFFVIYYGITFAYMGCAFKVITKPEEQAVIES